MIIPCRNERAVLRRKLANLAHQEWPPSSAPHRLVLVDDGSDDGSLALAQRLLAQLFAAGGPVRAEARPNRRRPGKPGAVATGLAVLTGPDPAGTAAGTDGPTPASEECGGLRTGETPPHAAQGARVDVIVLTDADVVLDHGALLALGRAFGGERPPGMACGSQRFVLDLDDQGRPLGADGGPPRPAPGSYDRWTAAVRALESRSGRLFSVHGQLLAWRAELNLVPTPGLAADDLDLMIQVRTLGLAVVKLDDAHFLECKTPPGPGREAQQRRRARAWFQVIHRCRLPAGAPLPDRLQFAAYRTLPTHATALALTLALLPPLAGGLLGSLAAAGQGPAPEAALGAALGVAFSLAGATSPPGRRLMRLLALIAASRREEVRGPLPDRWEMERG